ncbi:hypothetical protein GC173_13765 [bacterium]|nr:hypothetical protein [bacterium]
MPDVSAVHLDAALTNLSIAYRNTGHIAREIAPEVLVRRQSDRYFIHDTEREAFRQTDDGRAPGTEASEVDFRLSSDSYYCDDHALEAVIPDEERANADSPLQPEADRVELLTDKILLNQEILLAERLRAADVLPDLDLATETEQWDDEEVDPFSHVEAARAAILQGAQVLPNTLVLPFAVYTALRNHPKVVSRVSAAARAVVGPGTLAELFDVERVLVARTMRNGAAPGQAPSMAPVWGRDALLLHVPPRVGIKSLAPVLTFAWSHAGGSIRGHAVQSWREERRKATMIRVQKYYDIKVVAPSAAFILRNAIPA